LDARLKFIVSLGVDSIQESALALEVEFARFQLERQVSVRIQYLQNAGSITGWRSSLL